MSEPTTEPTAPAVKPAEPQTQGDPDDAPLGEPGKKALQAEREARKASEAKISELEKQLNEINRANETAIERATREAQEARSAVEKVPNLVAEQLRDHLVKLHDISDDDRDLFLTASDPETLLKQAARLVERTPTSPRPDPTQGGNGEPVALNSNGLEQALRSKLGIA